MWRVAVIGVIVLLLFHGRDSRPPAVTERPVKVLLEGDTVASRLVSESGTWEHVGVCAAAFILDPSCPASAQLVETADEHRMKTMRWVIVGDRQNARAFQRRFGLPEEMTFLPQDGSSAVEMGMYATPVRIVLDEHQAVRQLRVTASPVDDAALREICSE
jgi:hypothetical protein